MVCESETNRNIAQLAGFQGQVPTTSSWLNNLFSCTYLLADGPLVLSVKVAKDAGAARAYFQVRQGALAPTMQLLGLASLGLPAYRTEGGVVVFLKDNEVLEVNARALPPHVGAKDESRNDLAYTVASDVLACWTGK